MSDVSVKTLSCQHLLGLWYISSGGDMGQETMTIEDAMVRCAALPTIGRSQRQYVVLAAGIGRLHVDDSVSPFPREEPVVSTDRLCIMSNRSASIC